MHFHIYTSSTVVLEAYLTSRQTTQAQNCCRRKGQRWQQSKERKERERRKEKVEQNPFGSLHENPPPPPPFSRRGK